MSPRRRALYDARSNPSARACAAAILLQDGVELDEIASELGYADPVTVRRALGTVELPLHPGDYISGMWALGFGDAAIGGAVGLSPNAVRRRRQRRGHTHGLTRVPLDELIRIHGTGANARECAAAVGCTHRTAQELMWRLRLRTRSGWRRLGKR